MTASDLNKANRRGVGDADSALGNLRERRLVILLIPVVMLVTAITHWPALSARAISFDDHQYLLDNPLVKSPSWNSTRRFLTEVLKPTSVAGYYQPLSMISLMIDVAMGGGSQNFVPFHRTSLALHAMNAGLIVLLMYLLFERAWPAVLVGLLFGVHPLTIEPIPWIGERKTLLAAFFALGSMACYVAYAKGAMAQPNGTKKVPTGGSRRGPLMYWGCLALYLLALLSKPIVVPLALVLILMDYWPLRRLSVKTILEKIPHLVLCVLFAVITVISQGQSSTTTMPTKYPISHIPLVLCHNIVFYLTKMVWPYRLSSHYPMPEPLDFSQAAVVWGVIGTAVLFVLLALSLRKTRAAVTGWLMFFVAILPTMQIVGFSDVIASDKYAYFPAIGILITLAWALTALWNRSERIWRKVVIAGCMVATGAEIVCTRGHLPVWSDTVTHYEYMLSLTPNAASLHNNLAVELAAMKRFDDAVAHYLKAMELQPAHDWAYTNIGVAMVGAGKRDEAIRLYKRALERMPNSYSLRNNLGALLVESGREEEGLEQYRISRQLNMNSAEARSNYGNGLLAMGRAEEAVEEYRVAVELRPDLADLHNNLAVALDQIGKKEESLQHMTMACSIDPENFGSQKNLATRLGEDGRVDEAIQHARITVRLQPNNEEALFLLAQLLAFHGDLDEAESLLKRVVKVDAGFEPAHELIKKIVLSRTLPADGQATQPAVSKP